MVMVCRGRKLSQPLFKHTQLMFFVGSLDIGITPPSSSGFRLDVTGIFGDESPLRREIQMSR